MTSHPNQDWLDRSNADTFYHLERQGRTSPGLVPFIGAGLSTAYRFKDWKNLLLSASPPQLKNTIEGQLRENDYEGAAETLLQHMGADAFQNMVAASAGDSSLASFDFRVGTVSHLPQLASGPVITTNFDRVLEYAFNINGCTFESVISGPRPDLIADALHGNRRMLIKLHGDWQDRVGRTFAKSDYDANYGDSQPGKKRELLEAVEHLLFSSRSMLFIGASLGPDRTVTLLEKVHAAYAGVRHFAIMRAPTDPVEFNNVESRLRACGVLPLWYHAKDAHEHASRVEELVESIVERISVHTIDKPSVDSVAPLSITAPTSDSPDGSIQDLGAHFDRVVRLIGDGRLVFFLGSAIHYPTKAMAREFYEELARLFECDDLMEERLAVAQYIADRYGRENLYAEIRKLFARTKLEPRETHEMFAAWSQYKTVTGEPLPFPTIFTTNYDDVLERRLAAAGIPYHLLSYQADGRHCGLFYHRTPDNGLRIIERPRNIRTLSNAFVIIKLNGGFDRQRRIPESYATTRVDYWNLAARMADILPMAIQDRLVANPLLFLGHGLAVQDIEALVRFAHMGKPGPRSWAVVLKTDGVEYWRQCGVEILNRQVGPYVNELRRRLATGL